MLNENIEQNTTDFTSDLSRIKNKLNILNSLYQPCIDELNDKYSKFKKGDDFIENYLNKESEDLVIVNLGGKTAKTYLKKLIFHKDSLFYKLSLDDLHNFGEIRKEFFIDISNRYFTRILNFIRTGILIFEDLNSVEVNYLKEDLNYLGLWEAVKTINNSYHVKIINATYSSIHTTLKSIFDFNQLHIKNNKSGFATNSSSNSWFILELDKISNISRIFISSLPNSFKPSIIGSGKGTSILLSETNNFTNNSIIATIPDTYSNETITIIKFKPTKAKFIKFNHPTDYINIGYLAIS